jgi:uncharacterized protein with NRDE domain
MCLIAFAIDAHPDCPLLIAANRDEFFSRPTAALHRWHLPGGGEVVAGRDLQEGGTWLGVSAQGRVAMLTNVRQAVAAPAPRSRGELVTRWLQGDRSAQAFADELKPDDYGGFNLVLGDFHSQAWHWLGNCDPAQPHASPRDMLYSRTLGSGIWGLSNAGLDSPWPKLQQLKSGMALSLTRLKSHDQAWNAPLIGALGNPTRLPFAKLPKTGVSAAFEAALSSAFVHAPELAYGTRSSLVLRVHPGAHERALGRWQVDIDEWTHSPGDITPGSRPPAFAAASSRASQQLHWLA